MENTLKPYILEINTHPKLVKSTGKATKTVVYYNLKYGSYYCDGRDGGHRSKRVRWGNTI